MRSCPDMPMSLAQTCLQSNCNSTAATVHNAFDAERLLMLAQLVLRAAAQLKRSLGKVSDAWHTLRLPHLNSS